MANKIKKGDEVIVLAGKDKGRRGNVIQVLVSKQKILVEDINVVKKHEKPNPNTNTQGGIIDIEKPIHISNVALYNHQTDKADRVGFKSLASEEDKKNRKVRYFKSNNETIDI